MRGSAAGCSPRRSSGTTTEPQRAGAGASSQAWKVARGAAAAAGAAARPAAAIENRTTSSFGLRIGRP